MSNAMTLNIIYLRSTLCLVKEPALCEMLCHKLRPPPTTGSTPTFCVAALASPFGRELMSV
jgi:hypothetical protein